jgi:hypothetical protein
MSDLTTALKDAELQLRTAGTPATADETGTGKFICNGKQSVMGYIETTALNITTGNTYVFKFQESAVLGSGYTDIPGAQGIAVTAVGRTFAKFQVNKTAAKPYIRHYLDLTGGTASFDGNIYIVPDDEI